MSVTETTAPTVDPDRLNTFLGRMLGDMGATANAALVIVGDRLGLFKALAAAGPLTSTALARKTGTTERYVREWLAAQAASGYITYDRATETFHLEPEQAEVLANENGPAFLAGFFDMAEAMFRAVPKITDAFRSGRGVGWHEHSRCLFCGTERFFRAGYRQHLVSEWLPALDGVVAKLQAGASVADIGCGHGASTILMAQAFPRSRFFGFDYHLPSIEAARDAAAEAGVADRITFEVATAHDFPASGYDLIAFFDCLHDMGDPSAPPATCAPHCEDGTWLIVEPFADDHLADNLNPVGRIYYAASTMVCTPASLSQEVGWPSAPRPAKPPARRGESRRLHPLPPRHRNPLQPDPGGPRLTRPHTGKNAMETLTLPALRRAIESRDGTTLAGFYANDALLRIIDQNHPPSHPMEIRGAEAISSYYDDVCGEP